MKIKDTGRLRILIAVVIAVGVLIAGGWYLAGRRHSHLPGEVQKQKDIYTCPMHPSYTSDKPGDCPICGMSLVKKTAPAQSKSRGEKKIRYYRNPMNPEVTSPVPMKDSMGMDYVPVYEDNGVGREAGIYISPEKQQMIGVTKEKVEKRRLSRQIATVGRVVYDPALFTAQEEYLQVRKAGEKMGAAGASSIQEQMDSLVDAARKKLILMGMSEDEIAALAKKGKAQDNLYLPNGSDSVWVYITIYEYEAGLVKEKLPVEIEAVAFPGELFHGEIAAITPVLNEETRSLQVRAEIQDPEHKLKPQMFVNAKINVELGEQLAVPETAVLDTGMRKIVYLAKDGDMLEAREVTLGQKAQGYFAVFGGLQEGDIVVTSGNFLVDSESKLKGAVQQ